MRRFWEMSKDDIDDAVEEMGLNAWREKVNTDRAAAPEVLAAGPNPWLTDNLDFKLQNIIQSLAPKVAERMKAEAPVGNRREGEPS